GSHLGPDTQEKIDVEVRKLVDEGYDTAKRILKKEKKKLDLLANGLLEYETLTGSEITQVLSGKPLNRDLDDFDEPDDKPTKSSVTSIPKTGNKGPRKGGGLKSQPQS
ncbi:cell division protein FtsH, partial [Paracoccaceae bacterium]|nr:cell division protein FtsH [Paracoccaceae bacterium]